MMFTEVLTIIFIALKVTAVINWPWWVVLLPEIVAAFFYLKIIFAAIISAKRMTRAFDRMVEKERERMNRF